MPEEIIKCGRCQSDIGTKNGRDIAPNKDTNVSIEKGFIYFQCKACSEFNKVAPNDWSVTLLRPGAKRVF